VVGKEEKPEWTDSLAKYALPFTAFERLHVSLKWVYFHLIQSAGNAFLVAAL
jgi:hypothetical protein